MSKLSMLDAVSAAVKGETPPETDAADLINGPADAQDPPEGDEPVEQEAEAPADAEAVAEAAAEGDSEGEEAEPDRARGPDGKFVAKAPEQPKDPAEAPVPTGDPVNDPLPPNARASTRERITTLADMVKTTSAERDTLRNDFETVMSPIREAGATVEQFREAMNLLKWINSPHQHEQAQALQYLQGTSNLLAERLGQVPPGADALAGFADLQQAVQGGHMPRQYAEEVAKARRQSAASQQFSQQQQVRTQQEQARQAEAAAGQAAVRTVEQTLEATDPNYKAKVAVLRADVEFVNHLRTLPPAQWATAFAEKYRTVRVQPVQVPAAGHPAGRTPQPLRTKTPAGNTAKEPSSMLEAVSAAIGRGR